MNDWELTIKILKRPMTVSRDLWQRRNGEIVLAGTKSLLISDPQSLEDVQYEVNTKSLCGSSYSLVTWWQTGAELNSSVSLHWLKVLTNRKKNVTLLSREVQCQPEFYIWYKSIFFQLLIQLDCFEFATSNKQ